VKNDKKERLYHKILSVFKRIEVIIMWYWFNMTEVKSKKIEKQMKFWSVDSKSSFLEVTYQRSFV
jgi:hypothetical protein